MADSQQPQDPQSPPGQYPPAASTDPTDTLHTAAAATPAGTTTAEAENGDSETVHVFADPEVTATEALATMLANPNAVAASSGAEEEPIELAGEQSNLPIAWAVVGPAMAVVVAIVAWGLFAPTNFSDFASGALTGVIDNLGWAFTLFGTVFVVFMLAVAFSRFGSIKLGRDDEAPEFSNVSWFAMMFAAGMGIGLMFYGTSEPLSHYRAGVPGIGEQSVGGAMATTLFHWTLHPWCMYALVGLAIAYSTFRMGRKQLLSSCFVPLIGERRANGLVGAIIDILAIVATMFGTACSLGIGATQIRAGLAKVGLIEIQQDSFTPGLSNPNNVWLLVIIAVLTICFVISAVTGVSKGIQYISNANMVLATLLAVFVFVLGPSVYILNMIPTSLGNYLASFFEMTARTADSANGEAGPWLSGWTIFYWAWWISWSPFVGMFLARISRGRTIREFIVAIVIVPSAVSVVWFSIFGGTAIFLESHGGSIYGDGDAKRQLFDLLYTLPGGTIAAFVAMILLATFFITSADSASTVMGSMSQNGALTANRFITALWGIGAAAIGIVLLFTGGADTLSNLQNVTIIAASPFLFLLVVLIVAVVKDLSNDPLYLDHKAQQRFAMKLAREARIHQEHLARQQQLAQLRRGLKKLRHPGELRLHGPLRQDHPEHHS
ncbi:BCCT family transporter [Corynebacterium choanae]|uniref:Glycine betaine transporter BetP n=1 Tax=Corynebacterium choanae TaxID=1862358 RepID=A0A3G6J9J7_9CORY|nr:BCCT family transporter [Corynebacterium choanae]AZA13120.1 Glycine betaine transporter BetP [Corynebacterium choanae]